MQPVSRQDTGSKTHGSLLARVRSAFEDITDRWHLVQQIVKNVYVHRILSNN
jgi:hypothetical protein